jgi:hypothetical protein
MAGVVPVFEFESSDSLAQFSIWILPAAGGGAVSVIAWAAGGWWMVAGVFALCAVLVAGLRSSISVGPGRVTITRKWFRIPYRRFTAAAIENVFFGGDYGLEEGAMGVVVRIEGRDIHLGTSRNMHFLYDALQVYVRKRAAPAVRP